MTRAATSGPPVGQILRAAAQRLAALPESTPRLEAELLVCEATGWSRTTLIAWPERALSPRAASRLDALLQRRLAGEPIAYIRGRQAFWTFELKVTPATLIPRPETELLVETALALLNDRTGLDLADLGTGSGAIAAALASERPDWHLMATDRCPAALAVAKENFRELGLHRIAVIGSDWLDAMAPESLDVILSNPPYVAAGDTHLQRGDLRFEPYGALCPGGDGLDDIRAIASAAPRCLRPGGLIAVEHGFDQGAEVRRIFAHHGLEHPETRVDLAGLDRITLAWRTASRR
ncbi:peptide chain release factor N(5)-glutamine methyltransferase [Thiorhodococcus mannitoliphagus]|uniref:Release factor glutamine methyltransferase n=1 Tax=Thiorhodococcus mannitoliphagus TaxID=329406 RepID=A0A6P1DWN4_9GAMM|nr:peptide chain release factor N(5)-glutamine methyltransferase [Thiorhodococcus mannitoliphagus]NEX22109.1 peptide chain release factor N(5)-glutamine methyltransferase [Thiorhodococcus mannitoliphagus]